MTNNDQHLLSLIDERDEVGLLVRYGNEGCGHDLVLTSEFKTFYSFTSVHWDSSNILTIVRKFEQSQNLTFRWSHKSLRS